MRIFLRVLARWLQKGVIDNRVNGFVDVISGHWCVIMRCNVQYHARNKKVVFWDLRVKSREDHIEL
jgi:hypothetical protein